MLRTWERKILQQEIPGTTSTDQSVKQKNTGSGDSANYNCGQNLIKAGVDEQACEFED